MNWEIIEENAGLAKIKVIGVGGAGGNAVIHMINHEIQGADFICANTDSQALDRAKGSTILKLGDNVTRGLGAGADPQVGKAAAERDRAAIEELLSGADMIFITAGMGGGTGTGAAHVIARAAKELNILTVGVTTLPFSYEGPKRMRRAMQGLEEFKKHLDTVIVVPNQNLFKIASETTTFKNAFILSNNVLKHGVQSVTDLMVRPGMINLDFADVETVMSSMGKAMMGTGEAEGENRGKAATEMALNNPLIDEYSLKGAKGLLVNITGGDDLTLFEVEESVNRIRAEVDPEAELIFGAIEDTELNGKIRVSIVATALDGHKTENKTVLNMVSRIQNRNTGYSENLFSHNPRMDNSTLGAIDGATALKLDESFEIKDELQNDVINDASTSLNNNEEANNVSTENNFNDLPTGVSIESASYIENSSLENNEEITEQADSINNEEEYTPKLFSEENNTSEEINNENNEQSNQDSDELFDQDLNEEEDFEIPAFLRKQKF